MSLTLSLILTILGIFISVLIPLISHIHKARKENRHYYSVIWKKSTRLKPKDMLGERPYSKYYYERSEDIQLKRHLERRDNVLITGPPLSGKTRAVFQQLVSLKKKAAILIPRNVSMSTFVFPVPHKFWRKKTIFIDDFQYFIEKQDNYHLLLKKAKENNINVIITCHTGQQYKKVKNKLTEHSLDIETIFGGNIIEYSKISSETAKEIAGKMNIEWNNVKFNGTVGSIFMKLSEMERRFDNCDNIEKTILNTIRMMYISGLWENNVFSLEWIKLAAKKNELEGKDFEWAGWMKSLEDKEFIKIVRRNKIWADDAYLQYIIKPHINIPDLEIFDEMIEVFAAEISALIMIGEKSFDTGLVDIDLIEYMKISIKALSKAHQNIKQDEGLIFAKTCELLGIRFWKLSEFEDVVENCLKAQHFYSEALKIIKPGELSELYSKLQKEIGNTYTTVAEIQDTAQNCRKAIDCYNESLKYFNHDENPLLYSSVEHSLGSVYNLLADIEEPAKNFKLAIESDKKALSIRTVEHYPEDYAATNNNLGVIYSNLSGIENKSENLKLSIEHFNNVLKVFNEEKNIYGYSLTMHNLGNVYSVLAGIENMDVNIKKSLTMLNGALKYRTPEKFPIQYARTQFSLGDVYSYYAKLSRSPEYCCKAIDSLEKGLVIFSLEDYPLQYAMSQNKLGDSYALLSQFENKSENYQKALFAFDEALKIYTEENYPRNYAIVQESISDAKKVFFK